MHEMQPIVTDDRGVCLSVCLSVSLSLSFTMRGHSVQPLPNNFGLLFYGAHGVTVRVTRAVIMPKYAGILSFTLSIKKQFCSKYECQALSSC